MHPPASAAAQRLAAGQGCRAGPSTQRDQLLGRSRAGESLLISDF